MTMAERMLIRHRSGGTLDSGDEALVGARGLAPDLLREASRRLELASLLVAAAFGVVLVLNNLLRAADWPAAPRPAQHNLIAIAMIVVSGALFALSRSGRLEPRRLLDVGLVYEVVVALGISMGDHLGPLSSDRPLEEISWLCVWIVVLPLVVPATTGKALLASLAAASTWPLAFLVGRSLGQPAPPVPVVVLNVLENYLAAALALVPALVIRRLGAHVERARAMGSYELVERLDRGGMGEIWRARHRMLARPAAIKLIRPEALGAAGGRIAEALVRRFEREAQATAALHSPHTIELYDFGVTRDGTFYYVMEILDGLDLEALVRRFGPLPAERAIHLLLQACDSLADAHHVGLVHRDVKPANIYVCRKGLRDDFIKVLDFGLVKASWAEETTDTRLTMEGMAGGTPAYIAPEVALGNREIDARVDLYALGCVAYWLVTGHTVFDAQTPIQMALHHAHTPPLPPSQRTEMAVPEPLERLILCCLEKDPDKRPASALELAERLAACPLPSRWTPDRARRWWQLHLPSASDAAV
jgi:serine/threonine-protein kinase